MGNRKAAKRPRTFHEFLKSKKLSHPGVRTWGEFRSAVSANGDDAIVAARKLWRQYLTVKAPGR